MAATRPIFSQIFERTAKRRNWQKLRKVFEHFLNFSNFFEFFGSFCQFLRFAVRSIFFEKIDLVAANFLVLKSSKSESSSQFFSRLKFSRSLVIYYPSFFFELRLVNYSTSTLLGSPLRDGWLLQKRGGSYNYGRLSNKNTLYIVN